MRIGLMCALLSSLAFCADVYFNDFNAAPCTTYPEWTSSGQQFCESGGHRVGGLGAADGGHGHVAER